MGQGKRVVVTLAVVRRKGCCCGGGATSYVNTVYVDEVPFAWPAAA